MDEENNDDKDDKKEDNSGKFTVMPDEFFSFKYQQSRVRKEQQMMAEKEQVDKKKRKQEEKMKRIAEREKMQKEREEEQKRMKETKEQERQKKEAEKKKLEEQKRAIKELQERKLKQEQEEKKRILELRKKSIEEKKDDEKASRNRIKVELERINKLKQETDYSKLNEEELKEFNKNIEEQRKEALKEMKEQEIMTRQEQKKIEREAKEEERIKKKEAEEALRSNNLQLKGAHKKLDLSFIQDLEQRLGPKQTKTKRVFVICSMILCLILLVFTINKLFKDLGYFINEETDNNQVIVSNTLPISTNYGYEADYGMTIPENNNNNNNEVVSQEVKQTNSEEFFKFFFAKDRFNMGSDQDNDYLTDKEEPYYGTKIDNRDTDEDLYPDGEEVSNLYNPIGHTPDKILDNDNIRIFSNNNNIEFYYPNGFTVSEDPEKKIIDILPSDTSDEYFEISLLNNNSINFLDFIKQDLGTNDINLLKLNIPNEAYIDSIGKSVYINFNNNVMRIKYINNSSEYNYSATFAMLIRSLELK
ncbi:MAG TPA: hypothetical protein PLM63_01925 [bacterium]|nr:hypothetical protein [bacterium]